MARLRSFHLACLVLAGLALLIAETLWGSQVDGASVAGCSEVIRNGSFEIGEQGWQQTSAGGYDLVSDFNPRTGSMGGYLAGTHNANDRLSQEVVLPVGVITLRGWWFLTTTETGGAFDEMTTSLLLPDGRLLADLMTVDSTSPAGVWNEFVIDLSTYKGESVGLRFAGRTDESNITDFYIDDVSIVACAADVQPTATVTATAPPPTTIPSTTPSIGSTPSVTATPTATSQRAVRPIYLPHVVR